MPSHPEISQLHWAQFYVRKALILSSMALTARPKASGSFLVCVQELVKLLLGSSRRLRNLYSLWDLEI